MIEEMLWGPHSIIIIPLALALALPALAADECGQTHQIRADLEQWRTELGRKSVSSTRVTELLTQLHMKTGFARELPDVEQGGTNARVITIQGVDEIKARLTGRSQ